MLIMPFMTYCERASKTFKNGLPYCTLYSVQCELYTHTHTNTHTHVHMHTDTDTYIYIN